MRQILSFGLVFMLATTSLAVTPDEVAYIGGTSAAVKSGDFGTLDTTSSTDLVFSTTKGRLSIPYASLQRVEYSKEVLFHLGVAPAIAVSLVKRRERKHVFTLTYSDKEGVQQVAVFEVSKELPAILLPVLNARSPTACILSESYRACTANTKVVMPRRVP